MIGLGTIINAGAVIAGSALIEAVGINLVFGKKINVGNILPALLVPVIYELLKLFLPI